LLREKWPDIGHKDLASGVDIDEPTPAAARGYKAGWTLPGRRTNRTNPDCEQQLMATDYDAPRKTEEDLSEDSIEALKAQRTDKPSAVVDEDESDLAEGYELPGADLSGEELLVRVLPPQADEFTCASCFLVRHRSQVAREKDGLKYCKDCEG
jgi:hypothetical protein